MPSYRAKVSETGTIEIPSEIRQRLGIEPGCDVEFFVTLDGEVFFHAIVGKAKAWHNLFEYEKLEPPISVREMDEAIAEAVVEKHDRITAQASKNVKRSKKASAAE